MLLRAITGKENWHQHSAKMHLFYSPTTGGAEINIGDAIRDPSSEITQVTRAYRAARPGFRSETGSWTDATYEVPVGAVFKIFAHRTGAFGVAHPQGNQFVQMRSGAALRRVRFGLSSEPTALYSAVFVEGRFDLLTFEQARLAGCRVLPHFARFSEEATLRRTFTYAEVEPEASARPVPRQAIVEVSGREVVVPTRTRRRVMPT